MNKHFYFILFLLQVFSTFSQNVGLDIFATGFTKPVSIQHTNDSRLFIVEKSGIIKILNANGTTNATPFLNISSIVGAISNEQGLLGLAFHPNYSTNGLFFVNYTNIDGNTVIAKYTVSANPNIANNSSGNILLTVTQPYDNHNGGNLAFGSDGYLYIGMGDGGNAGDPLNNAQNGNSLLGKILRIEVGVNSGYTIPADNPFIANASILDEIWMIGLRNPWKFSFDINNNDLWIADVGQYDIEEVNHIIFGTGSGLNLGWRCYEGNTIFNSSGCNGSSSYTMPNFQYNHGGSPYKCSITGGYVYRGTLYPNFNGLYFYSDYCSGEIYTSNPNNSYNVIVNTGFTGNFSSFGEDVNGELYVADLSNGIIYKIIDETLDVEVNQLLSNNIVLNPNPAKDIISIQNKTNLTINTISVYNSLGVKVIDNKNTQIDAYKIGVSHLKEGIYFIKINFKNNKTIIKKIIIK